MTEDGPADDAPARLTVWVRGTVQGVGFRWWTRARALELGLVGSASNLADGRVEVVAQGRADRCRALLALLGPERGAGTAAARGAVARPGHVTGAVARWDVPKEGLEGFLER